MFSVFITSTSFNEGLSAIGTLIPSAGMRIQFFTASSGLYAGTSGTWIGYGLMMISGAGIEKGTTLLGLSGNCVIRCCSVVNSKEMKGAAIGAMVITESVTPKKKRSEKEKAPTNMNNVFCITAYHNPISLKCQ